MIVALDHIGIAVPDLEKAILRFVRDFGRQDNRCLVSIASNQD